MRSILKFLILVVIGATGGFAQMNQPMVGENTTKISDHVWAIMGFPNIAIVVGNRATLIVDTGWARKMEPLSRVWPAKLAPNNASSSLLPLTSIPNTLVASRVPTRHYLIRNAVQQQEMEKHGQEMIEMFSRFSAQNKELLAGVVLRSPDIIFDQETMSTWAESRPGSCGLAELTPRATS